MTAFFLLKQYTNRSYISQKEIDMSLISNHKYPHYSLLHNKNTSPQMNHCIQSQQNCNSDSGNTRHFFRKEVKTKQTGWQRASSQTCLPVRVTDVSKQTGFFTCGLLVPRETYIPKIYAAYMLQIQSSTTRQRWFPFRLRAKQLTKASSTPQIHTIYNEMATQWEGKTPLTLALLAGMQSARKLYRSIQGKHRQYPLNWRLAGPHGYSGRSGEDKICPPARNRTSFRSPLPVFLLTEVHM